MLPVNELFFQQCSCCSTLRPGCSIVQCSSSPADPGCCCSSTLFARCTTTLCASDRAVAALPTKFYDFRKAIFNAKYQICWTRFQPGLLRFSSCLPCTLALLLVCRPCSFCSKSCRRSRPFAISRVHSTISRAPSVQKDVSKACDGTSPAFQLRPTIHVFPLVLIHLARYKRGPEESGIVLGQSMGYYLYELVSRDLLLSELKILEISRLGPAIPS